MDLDAVELCLQKENMERLTRSYLVAREKIET